MILESWIVRIFHVYLSLFTADMLLLNSGIGKINTRLIILIMVHVYNFIIPPIEGKVRK